MSDTHALFIPCTMDGLPKNSGSARIRAAWVVRYWDGAALYDRTQSIANYDLFVFQKCYLTTPVLELLNKLVWYRDGPDVQQIRFGRKIQIAFDLCDPDFLDLKHERRLLNVLSSFDFCVAPTKLLADWLGQYRPSYVIPDRVDLNDLPHIGHCDSGSSRPTLVWAGYQSAMEVLVAMKGAIGDLSLKVYAPKTSVPFGEFWTKVVSAGDILVNPKVNEPPWCYKSDNKTVIAWALGMPVARTPDELNRLRDPKERIREARCRLAQVASEWDVRLSVQEWKRLAEDDDLQ